MLLHGFSFLLFCEISHVWSFEELNPELNCISICMLCEVFFCRRFILCRTPCVCLLLVLCLSHTCICLLFSFESMVIFVYTDDEDDDFKDDVLRLYIRMDQFSRYETVCYANISEF